MIFYRYFFFKKNLNGVLFRSLLNTFQVFPLPPFFKVRSHAECRIPTKCTAWTDRTRSTQFQIWISWNSASMEILETIG